MTMWLKNQPVAALRRATVLIYEDDGVTPAPQATDFTGCVTIRAGTSYAAAAGSLVNVGVDGEWYYEATQAETNVTATEVVVRVVKTGFVTARAIASIGFSSVTWIRDQALDLLRRITVLIYEDDGITPAPLATSFAGDVTIRKGTASYTAAGGTLTNVGIDGEWIYEATQSETDVDATDIVVRVTKGGFTTALAIANLEQTTPVPIGSLTISNITPDVDSVPGTVGAFSSVFSVARITPIEFDLTGIPADSRITIAFKFSDRDETYVALDAEGNWVWPFDVDSSIGDLGVEPVHVRVLPRGGWHSGDIAFKVAAAFEATS